MNLWLVKTNLWNQIKKKICSDYTYKKLNINNKFFVKNFRKFKQKIMKLPNQRNNGKKILISG